MHAKDDYDHAVFVHTARGDRTFVMDPLGRGRYQGQWVPKVELRQFSGTHTLEWQDLIPSDVVNQYSGLELVSTNGAEPPASTPADAAVGPPWTQKQADKCFPSLDWLGSHRETWEGDIKDPTWHSRESRLGEIDRDLENYTYQKRPEVLSQVAWDEHIAALENAHAIFSEPMTPDMWAEPLQRVIDTRDALAYRCLEVQQWVEANVPG